MEEFVWILYHVWRTRDWKLEWEIEMPLFSLVFLLLPLRITDFVVFCCCCWFWVFWVQSWAAMEDDFTEESSDEIVQVSGEFHFCSFFYFFIYGNKLSKFKVNSCKFWYKNYVSFYHTTAWFCEWKTCRFF